MLARFAITLGVSADQLLGLEKRAANGQPISLKVARRMRKVDHLPRAQQAALLKTIDAYITAADAQPAKN